MVGEAFRRGSNPVPRPASRGWASGGRGPRPAGLDEEADVAKKDLRGLVQGYFDPRRCAIQLGRKQGCNDTGKQPKGDNADQPIFEFQRLNPEAFKINARDMPDLVSVISDTLVFCSYFT